MAGSDGGETCGVYVHVPFCRRRCPYCDFESTEGRLDEADAFVDAVAREATDHAGRVADTVYLGGGTPTALPEGTLGRLMETIRRTFRVAEGAEVSVEANPETITAARARHLVSLGVTRVSLGAQSLEARGLAVLGRSHGPADVAAAFAHLRRTGAFSCGLDLIYGYPGHERAAWGKTLDRVSALAPDHVSIYAFHPPSHGRWRAWCPVGVGEGDEDLAADLYETARHRLAGAGYEQYELSNFCRPGHGCRHNVKYWRGGEYIGLGPAAWSLSGGWRRRNLTDLAAYVSAARAGASAVAYAERLGASRRVREAMVLGLRLREGFDEALVARLPGFEAREVLAALATHERAGLLASRHGRTALTPRGQLLANEVMADLI